MKCHPQQQVTPGRGILGGISVSVPMQPYLSLWRKKVLTDAVFTGLIWFLGVFALGVYRRQMSRPLREREQAEASLRISQENYRTLVENSQTGIYVSQNGLIVLANSEFARIHGYTLEEVIGMPSLKFVHPEDRAMALEHARLHLAERPATGIYRVRGMTKDGATIYVQRRIAPTTFNGRPALIGNEIDITGQMLAETEMAASERQLRRLADGLIDLRESEHERFAKEIHENIAQCIGAIKFKLESALEEKAEARELLEPILPDFQHTLAEILRIARRYRPMILEHVGFAPSITWLCRQFEAADPTLTIEKAVHVAEPEFPEALKIIVFRIVEQMLQSLSGLPNAHVQIGLELIQARIIFYLRANASLSALSGSNSEGAMQGELAMVALKRRCEKFGGTFLLSSAGEDATLAIATWNLYSKYPPDQSVEAPR